MANRDDERLLTTEEAARFLNCSPKTLAKARVTGVNCPTFVRLGRTVRYRPADLHAYIAQHKFKSTSCAENG